ncbi:MAG: hypothetical protein B6U95_01650 [Thermofilum sp. ex4484_82]|nr:MAG: hypothetical protein B6U95_01650 [Thermofilum sp. ex4484_82]OYT39601.1 MAG: hypothetical protein B6U96_01655 [Archaeoglobales archaeon ex4484_92]
MLGEKIGTVQEGNQEDLVVKAKQFDIAVGDILLILSRSHRKERVFIFRVLEIRNKLYGEGDEKKVANNLLLSERAVKPSEELIYLEIRGKVLGYVQREEDKWVFYYPSRIPEPFASVYRPKRGADEVLADILRNEISGNLFVGFLRTGGNTPNIPVYLPSDFLAMHMGIFGTTGCGKSNTMMVLIKSAIEANMKKPRTIGFFVIDPHDEYAFGSGENKHGIHHIVECLPDQIRKNVIGEFYYLTPVMSGTRPEIRPYARELKIAWSEILPSDIISIKEVKEQQMALLYLAHAKWKDQWIKRLLYTDANQLADETDYPLVTVLAVKRRLSFLHYSKVFVEDSNLSVLPQIIKQLENGNILIVNTSLISEEEQFLLTTIVSRTIFSLRAALKSSSYWDEFEKHAEIRLPATFLGKAKNFLKDFYISHSDGKKLVLKQVEELPVVLVTVEEAPSLMKPELMKHGSIFKDISRQGRKFRVGLLIISQQVTPIDNTILSQINTEINMQLGNEREIEAAINNASKNLRGYQTEFRILRKGDALLTASYRMMPIPIHVPLFDKLCVEFIERMKKSEEVVEGQDVSIL